MALVVGTFFAATYVAFFVLQFLWGPFLEADPGFWESQQGLDVVTISIGVVAAASVAVKSASLTKGKPPNRNHS